MPLSNLPSGVSPTGGQGQGSNTGGAMQSHFGDYHQQQQQQESSPPINSFLQHHSIVGNHNQPSQPKSQVRATPPDHQRQHFLPGPFYTLQQQQAFTQARLAVAAQVQAQQWQQQLAQVQFQAQQHQQQAQVQEAQPQQNIHSFPLAGQPSNTIFGSGVELASQTQLSHSSTTPTPTAAAMIGMQTALNFTLKAPEQGAQALVAPAVALHTSMAPSSYSIPAAATTTTTISAPVTVIADSTRKRLSGTKSTLTDGNNSSKSSKAPPTAPKQKPTDNYSSAGGKLQPPDSCVSSGLSSSAAKLIQNAMDESNAFEIPSECSVLSYGDGSGPSTEQKKQSSRDRNREHARCTRLRKKAYVDKLKELVDGLHAERNEDARKRRAAVQRLAEVQELRRKVVNTFLEYHCTFERDYNKWKLIVETGDGKNDDDAEEEAFWMKQPVTPYRSFRRCEIQKGNRVLKGIDALIRDSASMAVMIDTIGSRNLRWLQRKRDDFLAQHSTKRHHTETLTATHRTHRAASNVGPTLPRIICQNRQAQHAISSLSSSSGSSTEFGSSSEEDRRNSSTTAKNVTSSSSSNNTDQQLLCNQHHGASNDFHDYNAPSLPDPLPQSGGSSSSVADGIDSDNCVVGKQMCTDSSSGDDENSNTAVAEKQNTPKKRKLGNRGCKNMSANPHVVGSNCVAASQLSATTTSLSLPRDIARAGGISHNIKITAPPQGTTAINALLPNGHANLSRAPATTLPPFVGIGKRKYSAPKNTSSASNNTNHTPTACEFEPSHPSRFQASNSESKIISGSHQYSGGNITNNFNSHSNRLSSNFQYNASSDHNIITFDYGSVASSQSFMHSNRGIEAHYHINEDDMILTDDVLMCPFIFRSREAVRYGALAECVQPGMLRACFSPTSKLRNIEMIFDAMGFCQQLERASGNEGMAHIIPNSLEMALAPNTEEARVITLAQSPFKIVYVNEPWTAMTGFTQLDAEGKDLNILHRDPKLNAEVRSGSEPPHEYASAANGICTSGTYIQYDMKGREILNFMCSYPLSNLKDEVTHILHVCKELPPRA